MARVTVEDCIKKIGNRFDLILLGAQRARAISKGDPISIDRDNDKNPVVALREIAEETISLEEIESDLISSLQSRKQREADQAMRDEAASIAQDELTPLDGLDAFEGFGALGDIDDDEKPDDAAFGDMQPTADDDADSGVAADSAQPYMADEEGAFADEGSFADEAETPKEE